jgi:hypothetical protein
VDKITITVTYGNYVIGATFLDKSLAVQWLAATFTKMCGHFGLDDGDMITVRVG